MNTLRANLSELKDSVATLKERNEDINLLAFPSRHRAFHRDGMALQAKTLKVMEQMLDEIEGELDAVIK